MCRHPLFACGSQKAALQGKEIRSLTSVAIVDTSQRSLEPIRKTNIDEPNIFRRRGLLQEGPRNKTGKIQSGEEMLADRPANLQIGLAADEARLTRIRWP